MSSGASSIDKNVASRSADISYNAEGNMLNQSGSGFGASAANFGAPGSTVDPTMGSSSSYNSSSSSSYSSSGLGHEHNHKHKHHHHHGSSSSSYGSDYASSSLSSSSNSAYGSTYGSSASLSSGSSSVYGSTYDSAGSLSSSSSSAYGSNYSQDNAMTRSEEQLLVGKERVETGEAALRKTITSEYVSTNVPLIREKVVLQREPITESNRAAAYSGPELTEAEHVVTVSEERPIVEKEVVAKERVRLGKVAEVNNQIVGGEIRKEHIEFDQGTAPMATGSTNLNTTEADLNSGLYNKDRTGAYSSDLARKEANY